PLGHHGTFLDLVLVHGALLQFAADQFHHFEILLEELRAINLQFALKGLLVKINGPDLIDHMIEIVYRNDDIVVGAHIPQKADHTTLVEFYEFLGQLGFFGFGAMGQLLRDEHIPRNPCNMLLDQRTSIDQEVQAVGGKNVFQFQPIDPGGIGSLDIEIGKVVVQDVPHLDPKGLGVAKGAIIDRIDAEEIVDTVRTVGMQDGIDLLQAQIDLPSIKVRIEHPHP